MSSEDSQVRGLYCTSIHLAYKCELDRHHSHRAHCQGEGITIGCLGQQVAETQLL